MNAPTCLWSPMDGQALQQEMRQWRRPAQISSDREQRSEPQGRYAADVMDSFRMNLRQAKHALVIRDEEARKLRLAVTHLEGVLSLRERELQDTVLCLRGKSVPRPHQEWLQPGTSNSRLRLQVHRLQRALTAKQDRIEHLNRQASLGFLREAREQADEYRIEAARLSRALAAATGGAGRRGQFATRTPVDCLLSSDSRGPGAASTTLGFRVEESKNQGARASQEPDLSGALYARVPQFRSQNMSRSAPRCDVRRDAHQQQRSSDGSYGGRKVSPALDAEAAIQAYLGGHGAVREREMPPAPCLSPPSTTLDDAGLLFVPPPPRNNDGVYGLIHSGRRPTSSRRSAGRASARAGYGRFLGWSASPDRCRAFSEEKRLSCMAASARLRSAVRRSALEYNDVLALSEESRRLQMARAERARRARMARQRIARYREERIRELERRLERHCGTQSARTAPATDTAEPPGAQQHEGKRTGKGRYGHESGGEDTNTSAAIGTTDGGKLQRLSEARREIDAAIATAMEDKYGPAIAHHEPTGSAKTEIKDSQDGDFVNRQRQWRRSSSGTGSVTAEDDPVGRGAREDTHDLRKRQSGKPPLAPSHPGRRRRPSTQSALRRHSSVSEVAESEDASSDDEIGGGYHVGEVHTEAVGNGGDDGGWEDRWHDQHLPDEEESVQEEIVPARGWGEDERGGAPVDGVPPTLSKVGNERARRRLNDSHKRRRNPHYERNDEAIGENNDEREGGVPALDAVCEDVNGRDYLGSGRTKLTTRKSLPITERRDRRSSPRKDELDLRREGADVGGLFDKNIKPRARKREGGGCSNDGRQGPAGSSAEGAPINLRSRGRRRRRRDEGGNVRIDSGRFDDPVPSHGHTLEATIGATVASEIREETDIVDGGMEDDGDSCSSRWSLSAENEPQESQSADGASPTRQAQHVVGGGSGGSSPTRIANPDGERDRYDRQRKAPVGPEFEDGATFSGSGDHAGGIIPEYTDDFSEESQRRDQGFDVVYGVSSPSDEEHEAFAEAKADYDTQVRNAHQRGRLQPPFDTNTASNQRMINEPPFELPTTDTRQDDSSSVGGNERTGRLRPDNNSSDDNQVLLQPVSPPVLRHSVQTAEFGGALAECRFPEREQQARRTQPSREPVATKVDDKAGTNNLSSAHSVEQASTLRSHDTLNAGQSEMESGSEANDIVASLKIDSAALFASLSASTAGVSLSSKSMARPEESCVNVQGVAAPARQPGGSTSTFALSADDGDNAGATHVEDDDATATKSSSARIEMERASIAGNSRGLSGGEPNEEDSSTVRRQVAPPTSVSPTSSLERGDDGTTTVLEIGDRLDSLPVVEQQQTSTSREVSSDVPHRNGVIFPTQQVSDTATASVTELAAFPMGDRTTLLLDDEEAEQPQVQDHPDLEDIARRQDEDEGANGRPLHDRSRVDEDSDGGLERDAETRPALLLGGEDRLSGDDGGGIVAAAASERPPSGGEDSSRSSGSLLDAGGGGVDGDDDDGYF